MAGTEVTNRQILFKNFVVGWPQESDMEFVTTKKKLELREGQKDVIVRVLYLSCDPYQRGRMRNSTDSYIPPYTPGKPIEGYGLGKVILSSDPAFNEGDIVSGLMGWEDYSYGFRLVKIDDLALPISYYLGALGMAGFTAYVGFFRICEPKKGDTIYVSAASGAVGQMVGQFAKLFGCRVVGSAGSQQKVDLLTSKFGYDEAFNYKEEPDLDAALKRCCPDGIDIYFENVGGKMLDAVLVNMKVFGRIAVCGMVSQYNKEVQDPIYNLNYTVKRRLKIHGFLQSDHMDVQPEFFKNVIQWFKEGKLVYVEDIADGLEKGPAALIGLLAGKNVGKQSVKIADP
uniref:Double-bond reductase 2 n=1 Tax=Plagiochasma appendiculatum TaxID=157224 RepID=S5U4F4_9MARC|nr:double-bond reductase 2 [Plagiochasma appendiculatum]